MRFAFSFPTHLERATSPDARVGKQRGWDWSGEAVIGRAPRRQRSLEWSVGHTFKSRSLGPWQIWVLIPALSLTGCAALSTTNLSVLHFLILRMYPVVIFLVEFLRVSK